MRPHAPRNQVPLRSNTHQCPGAILKPATSTKGQVAGDRTHQRGAGVTKEERHRTRRTSGEPVVLDAFRGLQIHGIPHITVRIAVRCILHRYSSQGIHRCKRQDKSRVRLHNPPRRARLKKDRDGGRTRRREECSWSNQRHLLGLGGR